MVIKQLFLFAIFIYSVQSILDTFLKRSIINGHKATKRSFYVKVYMEYPSGPKVCGGMLIDKFWALSASHCFCLASTEGLANAEVLVEMGDFTEEKGKRWNYTGQIVIHPDYQPEWSENNIALIKLSRAVSSELGTPLKICTRDYMYSPYHLIAAGMGRANHPFGNTDPIYPSVLLEVEVLEVIHCLPYDNHHSVDRKLKVCTGSSDKGPCNFDNGGPLFVADNDAVAICLYGITNYMDDKCTGNAVYTRISAYRNWIDEFIIGNELASDFAQSNSDVCSVFGKRLWVR